MTPAAVRRAALALPEAVEAPHFDLASFRVRGKIFVTLPPDGVHAHVFAPEHVREDALERHAAFLEPLEWGGRVVGLRVRLADATSSVVTRLIREAWLAKAPARLRSER